MRDLLLGLLHGRSFADESHHAWRDRVILGCLALNASFEPLTMVPMRRALRLVIDGKAEIVEAEQRSRRALRAADHAAARR